MDTNENASWESDIDDPDLITEEKASFVLNEAKERLREGIAASDILHKQATYIFGILFVVVSSLIGKFVSDFSNWSISTPILVSAIYIAVFGWRLMENGLRTQRIKCGGNTPKNLATAELFSNEIHMIKFAEALSYHSRIIANAQRNERVGNAINEALRFSSYTPGVFVAVWAACAFISALYPAC